MTKNYLPFMKVSNISETSLKAPISQFSQIMNPLTHAFYQKETKATPRQVRQLNFISQFSTDIVHIPGKDNVVADALSRIEHINKIYSISLNSSIDYKLLSQARRQHPQLLNKQDSGLKTIKTQYKGHNLYCDISAGNLRPIIPPNFRKTFFDKVFHIQELKLQLTLSKEILFGLTCPKTLKNFAKLALRVKNPKLHDTIQAQ